MQEGFNRESSNSGKDSVISNARNRTLEAGVSPGLTDRILSTKEVEGLIAIGALAFTLVACQNQASATTPEQKNPENSNDPTTSEQNPTIEEEETSQEEGYAEGVPYGEFVFDQETEESVPVESEDSVLQVPELNEEMAAVYEILTYPTITEMERQVKSVRITGESYVVSIPLVDGLSMDYGENINFFKVGDSQWKINKTFMLQEGEKKTEIMQVESVNADTLLFLIKTEQAQVETLTDVYIEEPSHIVLEGTTSANVKTGVIEALQNLSSLQKEYGTVWIGQNLETVLSLESFNQISTTELSDEESISLEEVFQKILNTLKSLNNSDVNRYYGFDIWFTGDDVLITTSLENNLPENQVEELESLLIEGGQVVSGKDDNSIVLTEKVYKEAIGDFFKDLTDISMFTKEVEEGDVVWSIIKLRDIINAYNENSGDSFQEYILEASENIVDDQVSNALEKISQVGELNDIIWLEVLSEFFPELDIVETDSWPGKVSDFPIIQRLGLDFFLGREATPGRVMVDNEYNGKCFTGEIPFSLFYYPGLAIMDLREIVDGDINMYVSIAKLKDNGSKYILLSTINNDGKISLIVLTKENLSALLGGYRMTLGTYPDIPDIN